MARPNVTRMKPVVIDHVRTHVPEESSIRDVDEEVQAITSVDAKTGRSHVIHREELTRRVPESFLTDLTPIEKSAAVLSVRASLKDA